MASKNCSSRAAHASTRSRPFLERISRWAVTADDAWNTLSASVIPSGPPYRASSGLYISPTTSPRRIRFVTNVRTQLNHDERQFADPGRLDITRSPNHHVSFGAGIHHCLGAALSRVEGAAVFSRLLQICDRFDANGSPLRTRTALFRGYAHVPVAVSPSRAMADCTVTAP
jgi:hypothetical protein